MVPALAHAPRGLDQIRGPLGGGHRGPAWEGLKCGLDRLRRLFGAGALVLVYLGAGAIRAGGKGTPPPEDAAAAGATARETAPPARAARGAFAAGFFITLLNPMTIAFWLGILSAALAARPRERLAIELAYVGSLAAGCLLWVVFLSAALHHGRRLARGPALRFVSVAAGLVLIGFGVRFALEAVEAA